MYRGNVWELAQRAAVAPIEWKANWRFDMSGLTASSPPSRLLRNTLNAIFKAPKIDIFDGVSDMIEEAMATDAVSYVANLVDITTALAELLAYRMDLDTRISGIETADDLLSLYGSCKLLIARFEDEETETLPHEAISRLKTATDELASLLAAATGSDEDD